MENRALRIHLFERLPQGLRKHSNRSPNFLESLGLQPNEVSRFFKKPLDTLWSDE